MPFNDHELKLYRLEPGDIILTEGQSPELVGLSAVCPGGVDDLCIQATVHRFRAHRGVSVGFAQTAFKYSLLTGVFMRAASLIVNIAHLTSERLKPVPFPLPPQREQERIVVEVDRLPSVADNEDLGGITFIAPTSPPCLPVPQGATLESKSAVGGPHMSGTCEPSDAGPIGTAQGNLAATFCCLPTP